MQRRKRKFLRYSKACDMRKLSDFMQIYMQQTPVTDACDAAAPTWAIVKLSVAHVRACNGNIIQQYRRIEGYAVVMWIISVVYSWRVNL